MSTFLAFLGGAVLGTYFGVVLTAICVSGAREDEAVRRHVAAARKAGL